MSKLGRSRKKPPAEDIDPVPHKRAPKRDPRTLTAIELYDVRIQCWSVPRITFPPCSVCRHIVTKHIPPMGWCMDCKHECDGCAAAYETVRNAYTMMKRVIEDGGGSLVKRDTRYFSPYFDGI